jgi:major vault protein
VQEEIVGDTNLTVLSRHQYCVVLDPMDPKTSRNNYGGRELRVGPRSFFLLPGESLFSGIQTIYVLGDEEALLLKATEGFTDEGVQRTPGDLWMITGPTAYVPPVEVEVVEKRKRIPLDENEGIYVRDIKTGTISAVSGRTYLLEAHEELWEKELAREVEDLLSAASPDARARDKTRVVTYRVPHNAAVQLYNYKVQKSRVVFGPGLVMLEPEEQFSVVSLSGDTPKRPNVIKTLALMLGPDFMTDVVEVESADHARLRLQLSYNWHFEVNRNSSAEEAAKIFQVRDFVGDACKAIASRVRGCVATKSFDSFHKDSASIIRSAVFGSRDGDIGNKFVFNANNLVITNIDIQSVEPVDQRTRESLMKSVQLAIEITTKKQERNARHAAEGIEQDARGLIERQKIVNQKGVEEETQLLVQLQADCKAIESAGTAKAEAMARAEQLEIEGNAAVEQAALAAEASNIEAKAQLEEMRQTQLAEIEHQKSLAQLELLRSAELAMIETDKFKALVAAIKPETIKAIARAGPEMQARLLKGLGLKGYLMTDGNSPINLFNAAKGMVTPQQMMGQ